MINDPEKAALLAQARTAYHQLVTGTMARVVVDQNGERVEFTATKKTDLYAYIQELERGMCVPLTGVVRGPAGFYF